MELHSRFRGLILPMLAACCGVLFSQPALANPVGIRLVRNLLSDSDIVVTGRLNVIDSSLTIDGNLTDDGLVFVEEGSLTVTGFVTTADTPLTEVDGSVTVGGDYDGDLRVEGGGTVSIGGNFNGINLIMDSSGGDPLANNVVIGGSLTLSGGLISEGLEINPGSSLRTNGFTNLVSGKLINANLGHNVDGGIVGSGVGIAGVFQYGGGSGNTINFLSNSAITLYGPGAMVTPDGVANGLSTLSGIDSDSQLTLLGGNSLAISGPLTNSGLVCIGMTGFNVDHGPCSDFQPGASNIGALTVSGNLNNQHLVVISPSSNLTVFSGNSYTQGSLGTTTVYGSLSAGSIDVQGNLLVSGGTLNGNVTIEANGHETGQGTINGNLRINGGDFQGPGSTVNGNLTINGGEFASGRDSAGAGTIVTGNVFNAGTLDDGGKPGSFDVGGNFTMTSDGKLQDSLNSSTSFDQVDVSGLADIGGTLDVTTNFDPYSGETLSILNAASLTGEFSDFVPENFNNKYDHWTVVYTPTSAELVANTPEPSTIVLLGIGFLGLAGYIRRRRPQLGL